jgi:hypothetical protein
LSTGPTFETISFEEKLAGGALVGGAVACGGIASVVLVVEGFTGATRFGVIKLVDESGTVTLVVVVAIGRSVVTRGVEFDAVRVNTRTSSKRGLDHVTQ